MGLPSKAKTWNWTANQRSTFSTILGCTKDILFGYKTAIAAMSGVTIKGSSVGATSSMDATDRWTSAAALGGNVTSRTTNGCTWIVFTMSGFGGADFLIAIVGSSGTNNQCLMILSPGGNFTVSNTQCPTATDEVSFNVNNAQGSQFHSPTASADRLWSIGTTSDGTGIYMLVARSGVENFFCGLQAITSSVVSPASFSPAIIIWSNTTAAQFSTGSTGISGFLQQGNSGTWNAAARANGGSGTILLSLFFGTETYANSGSASTRLTFAPELQGGGNTLIEASVWSEGAATRGKLGVLVDFWIGFVSGATGDTYPNDTSRQFLQWGSVIVLPWDGSSPVLT